MSTDSPAAQLVERLWRVYAPYQRGRNTSDDLASMLAILVLAKFVQSDGAADVEFVEWWKRAAGESSGRASVLADIRAAVRSASRHPGFPVPHMRNQDAGLLNSDENLEDVPWAADFIGMLGRGPDLDSTEWSDVCDLLLDRHARENTRTAGEFHTPREVARLLVELAPPRAGDRILDPACGSGVLLAAAAQRIAGGVDGATLEAYATDRSNPWLATMNLAMHGVDRPVVRASEPASLFGGRGQGGADLVFSNPPFGQRLGPVEDVGWPFGRPSEHSADFAWLQYIWSRLSENGVGLVVMPAGAAWRHGREAEMRKAMVSGGALQGVIALPPHLFTHTAVPVHIWLLARGKSSRLPAADGDAVVFVDASGLGTQPPRRSRRVLTARDRALITRCFHEGSHDEPGFSRSVPYREILEQGGGLDPRWYVGAGQEQSAASDTDDLFGELAGSAAKMSRSSHNLAWILETTRLPRDGIVPQHARLRDIVDGKVSDVARDGRAGLLLAGPSGSLVRAEDYQEAGIPVVMPTDLTDSGFDEEGIRRIGEEQAAGLGRFRLRSGDIVLARRGELGRCAVVREAQEGWVCGTGCFVLRPPAVLDADYFAAYLRSAPARTWLQARSTGSLTMKTISLGVLGELPVVLPDLSAQRLIADIMAQVDGHERMLREQLALTRKIRRDALHGLLSG
ncbi:N-6 DNA methylase [Streptomyces xiamenensis]|uniref:N-6 DNA methylase n=1 Tax=Streptomyces xiamenensis TaxID=408015 RepID=UPI0035DA8CD9